MRERAGLLGGELSAGPRPAGGFQVRARLPLQPDQAVHLRPGQREHPTLAEGG